MRFQRAQFPLQAAKHMRPGEHQNELMGMPHCSARKEKKIENGECQVESFWQCTHSALKIGVKGTFCVLGL